MADKRTSTGETRGPMLNALLHLRNIRYMITTLPANSALLFTFSASSNASGHLVVEASVEELAGQDRSVAPDAYRRYWSGSESELASMLSTLGFSLLDQEGILASLRSHRDAARKLEVSQAEVQKAGFKELSRA